MNPLLAMAGLAEAAVLYSMILVGGVLAIITIVVALSLWRGWWRASMATAMACFFFDLIFVEPWSVFTYHPTDDPDDIYWFGRWKTVCLVWLCCFIACVAVSIMLTRRRRLALKRAADA